MSNQRGPPLNLIKGRRRTAHSELEAVSREATEFLEIVNGRTDWCLVLDEVEEKLKELCSTIQSYEELNNEYLTLLGAELPDDVENEAFQQWEEDSKENAKFLRKNRSVASKLELKKKSLASQIKSESEEQDRKDKLQKEEGEHQTKLELEKLQLQNQKEVEFEKIKQGISTGVMKENRCITHCKLPKVEITKFDGNKLEFRKFWGKFQNSVHSQNMPDVQKLTYLLEFMKPGSEADRALDGIEVVDSNYKLACKILKERFGDEHAIKNMHYKELQKISCAGGKTADLRVFHDTVEKHVRPLQHMEFDSNNGMFLSSLQSKLPEYVSLKMLEMNGNSEIVDFETFQNLLGQIIKNKETISENCEKPVGSHSFSKGEFKDTMELQKPRYGQYSQQSQKFGYGKHSSSTGALVSAVTKSGNDKNLPECFCCGDNHFLDQCPIYPDAQSVKAKLAEMKDLCHRCFRSGHRTQDCRVTKPCFYCKKTDHHNALCPVRGNKQQLESSNINKGGTVSCNVADSSRCQKLVLFPTAQVLVRKLASSNPVRSRVLLDSACNQTFITTNLAKRLGLKVKDTGNATSVFVFSQKKAKQLTDKETDVEIHLKDGTWKKLNVKVIPLITNRISRAPKELWDMLSDWKDLDYAEPIIEDAEPTPMDMLIGGDYYGQIFQGGKIEVNEKISLHRSSLGWIPIGQVNVEQGNEFGCTAYFFNLEQKGNDTVLQFSTCVNQQVPALQTFGQLDQNLTVPPNIEDRWNLESIGIMDSPYVSDDEKALEFFNKTVIFEDNRYQTKWPYKVENPDLPENIGMAKGQLRSLWNRHQETLEILNKIDEIIKDQETKGIIEIVNPDTEEGPLKHYVPFHAVITPSNQMTKTRIVYNASAKQKGKPSLNECLHKGPQVIADLCGMLLRFRLQKIAMIADVEKAFLQVGLQVPDRDVTRFFWLKDHKKPPTEENLVQISTCSFWSNIKSIFVDGNNFPSP